MSAGSPSTVVLDPALLEWLLDADPALRWQVERDLVGAPPETWRATRARIATEGFGARLLALQDPDGQWAGGSFFPGDFDFQWPRGGRGRGTAVDRNDVDAQHAPRLGPRRRCARRHCRPAGRELSLGLQRPALLGRRGRLLHQRLHARQRAWLGADVSGIAQWFLDHRMADGGWNCDWVEGSTRSSFHSTLNSMKGLLYYEAATGGVDELRAARRSGEEYLLERRLLRTLSTGELLGPWATRFAYPFRWFYSALNATEYFRAAARHDDAAPDPRLAEAIDVVRAARHPDGTWLQERRHPGRVWFEVDVPPGEPSKWLTLYGTRVLAWWDEATGADRPG